MLEGVMGMVRVLVVRALVMGLLVPGPGRALAIVILVPVRVRVPMLTVLTGPKHPSARRKTKPMRTLTWRTTVAHSMAGVATETAAMMTRAAPQAAQPVQMPKVAMELTMLRETTKHPTRLERTMMVLARGMMGPAMMRLA
jgi:hypothetical protein